MKGAHGTRGEGGGGRRGGRGILVGFFCVTNLHPQHLSGSRNLAHIFLGVNKIHVFWFRAKFLL